MKHPPSRDENSRFSGNLRHYHRSAPTEQRSWDEWIDGNAKSTRPSKNWLKILGITIAISALGGIIAGLIIELG